MYASTASGSVRWRLLGGNNRELGRGVLEYPDADACRADVLRILNDAPFLDAAIVRADRSRWAWRLRRDGVDVVTAGHAFHRRSQCEEALARFVRVAHLAPINTPVAVLAQRRRVVSSVLPPPPSGSVEVTG